jgi:hypothetical protein
MLLEQASAQSGKAYGPDSPVSFYIRMALAKLRRKSGEIKLATETYEKLSSDIHQILGNSLASIYRAQEGLAVCYEEAGRVSDAISAYRAMHATCVQLVGAESPVTRRAGQQLERLHNIQESHRSFRRS